jgi:hypothetical protein
MSQRQVERITDLIGLLYRKPRTISELAELTGFSSVAVRAWVARFIEEGLVQATGNLRPNPRGAPSVILEWIHLDEKPVDVGPFYVRKEPVIKPLCANCGEPLNKSVLDGWKHAIGGARRGSGCRKPEPKKELP